MKKLICYLIFFSLLFCGFISIIPTSADESDDGSVSTSIISDSSSIGNTGGDINSDSSGTPDIVSLDLSPDSAPDTGGTSETDDTGTGNIGSGLPTETSSPVDDIIGSLFSDTSDIVQNLLYKEDYLSTDEGAGDGSVSTSIISDSSSIGNTGGDINSDSSDTPDIVSLDLSPDSAPDAGSTSETDDIRTGNIESGLPTETNSPGDDITGSLFGDTNDADDTGTGTGDNGEYDEEGSSVILFLENIGQEGDNEQTGNENKDSLSEDDRKAVEDEESASDEEEDLVEEEKEEVTEETQEEVTESSALGSGTTSSEDLAVLADTTMMTEVIPEVTGEMVTDQLSSLCGDDTESGYWGDPVIHFDSYNAASPSTSPSGTNTNLAYSDVWGFGWVNVEDDGDDDDKKSNDYYQIGTAATGWFNRFWGNIFSLQSSISTSASYAIRIFATDVKISGNSYSIESTADSGTAISIEHAISNPIQTGEGITIENAQITGTNGITGTVLNGNDGGKIAITDSNFDNTDYALNIDASGRDSTTVEGQPGGNGGTITVQGKESTITGKVTLKANGGAGKDTDETPATNGGTAGTILVNVKEVNTDEFNIETKGGNGGNASAVLIDTGNGGSGGKGGMIRFAIENDLKAGTFDASGGNGGRGGLGGNGYKDNGHDGGDGGDGGDAGTVQIWASSTEAAPLKTGIVYAKGGNGGTGGDGGKSLVAVGGDDVYGIGGTGGDGGDGGNGGRIDIILTPGSLQIGLDAQAIGGNGGDGGDRGRGDADGLGGNGGNGGDGGHLSLWADTIDSITNLSINGGDGGTGGIGGGSTGGFGGDAPLATLYIESGSVPGTITATATGGNGGNDGGGGTQGNGGNGGHIYSTSGFGATGSSDVSGGTGLVNGAVGNNDPVTYVPPARPDTLPVPGGPATTTSSIALNDNSDLSPIDRILDYIAQLRALGFTLDEADLFSVLVPDITWFVIPATDPDGVGLWLVFTSEGALVSPISGIDTDNEALDPDLLLQITTLAQFVTQVSMIATGTLSDLMQTIDQNLDQNDETIVSLLQNLGSDNAADFIRKVFENPVGRDLVAGWPCPAGYTEEQRHVQFKEDYIKNYLVVMETLLADGMDPDSPEPDTGAGQLTALLATIIKYIQNSQIALEDNHAVLSAHADGTPWRYSEMAVYLDNEAAYNPVEVDLAALESLSWVDGGLSEAGKAVITTADIPGIPGLMQLISTGRFPDNAFTLSSAAFDEGISRYKLGEYMTDRCRDYYA